MLHGYMVQHTGCMLSLKSNMQHNHFQTLNSVQTIYLSFINGGWMFPVHPQRPLITPGHFHAWPSCLHSINNISHDAVQALDLTHLQCVSLSDTDMFVNDKPSCQCADPECTCLLSLTCVQECCQPSLLPLTPRTSERAFPCTLHPVFSWTPLPRATTSLQESPGLFLHPAVQPLSRR